MILAGSNRTPYRYFVKWVGRLSRRERKIRLFRIGWCRGEGPGLKGGWTASLSLNLVAALFAFSRDNFDCRITFCGVQLHKKRSPGGWIC